jgi:hypothetical protein
MLSDWQRFVFTLFPFLHVTQCLKLAFVYPADAAKQFPNNTSPVINATDPAELENAYSPPFYPSPYAVYQSNFGAFSVLTEA